MKQVLITGSTGVLGSALVPVFLRDPDVNVQLLIRAKDDGHLRERLARLFAFWQLDADSIGNRVRAYRGDVCQPRLGLAEREYRSLVDQLTHIVHSAGNVKLNQSLATAREHAVTSVENIVDLAWACTRNGQFQKLEGISTVGVAGCTSGLIPEERLTPPPSYRNTYEQAKAEAEYVLWEQIDKGLPVTIHRPSMIVGDSRTGRILKFQVFYYLSEFLTGRKTLGVVPDMGHAKLDIVPVDYVAEAISISCNNPDAMGRVFHLCSGPEVSLELNCLVDRLRTIYAQLGKRVPKLRQCSRERFESTFQVFTNVTAGRMRRMLQTLPHFLAYIDEEQAFDIRSTNQFVANFSLAVPQFDNYLEPIVSRYLLETESQSGFLL